MVVGIGGGDDGWRSYVVASVVGSGIANMSGVTENMIADDTFFAWQSFVNLCVEISKRECRPM